MTSFCKNLFFLLVIFLQRTFPRKGAPVLFFHSIDESDSPLSVSPRNFVKFLRYASDRAGEKNVLVTFDDGYKNNVGGAKKALELGFRVLIFVATAYIGKKNTFCRKDFPELEMMSVAEIGQLAKQGVEFGAHGHTHRNLPELSRAEISYEIGESKRILEEITGNKVYYFCYPRGKHNDAVLMEIKRQGFRSAFTSRTGIVSRSSRVYLLPRVPLNDAVSFLQFKALLSPWYGTLKYFYEKHFIYQHK